MKRLSACVALAVGRLCPEAFALKEMRQQNEAERRQKRAEQVQGILRTHIYVYLYMN